MSVFEELYKINVNENVEKKNGLSYLSWAWAWAEVKKVYANAVYEIERFEGKPYIYDENLGYMVFTKVTIENLTHEMWLPVMDGANKAMKVHPYEYTTKYGKKSVEAATMFDVNKTLMRCLVKNLAMFGLGLYIYAGEDLPDVPEENIDAKSIDLINELAIKYAEVKNGDADKLIKYYLTKFKVSDFSTLKKSQGISIINELSAGINRKGIKAV